MSKILKHSLPNNMQNRIFFHHVYNKDLQGHHKHHKEKIMQIN